LHLHRQRGLRQSPRGGGARRCRLGQGVQRGLRQPDEPARGHRRPGAASRASASAHALSHPRGRRAAHACRHQLGLEPLMLRAPGGLRGRAAADVPLIPGRDTMPLFARLALAPLPLVTARGPASAQGTLAVQTPAEPPGLDLTARPASAIAAVVHYNVQECLVKVDRNGKLVPWLADRWYTTDSKNYTFFLKKGVRFHNAREMKAADVKFVLERAANPE